MKAYSVRAARAKLQMQRAVTEEILIKLTKIVGEMAEDMDTTLLEKESVRSTLDALFKDFLPVRPVPYISRYSNSYASEFLPIPFLPLLNTCTDVLYLKYKQQIIQCHSRLSRKSK